MGLLILLVVLFLVPRLLGFPLIWRVDAPLVSEHKPRIDADGKHGGKAIERLFDLRPRTDDGDVRAPQRLTTLERKNVRDSHGANRSTVGQIDLRLSLLRQDLEARYELPLKALVDRASDLDGAHRHEDDHQIKPMQRGTPIQ